jgi:hypothetical protein
MRICANKVELLASPWKPAKKRNFTPGIAPAKLSRRQVHTDDLGVWQRKGAEKEEGASVVRSDLQTALRGRGSQNFCQLYDLRPHLRHQNWAVHTIVDSTFESVRSAAKGQFAITFDISDALQQKFSHITIAY